MCIHPEGGVGNDGTKLVLYHECGCGVSRALFRKVDLLPPWDQFFSLQHQDSGLCVHPEGGSEHPDPGTFLHLWSGCDVNYSPLLYQIGSDGLMPRVRIDAGFQAWIASLVSFPVSINVDSNAAAEYDLLSNNVYAWTEFCTETKVGLCPVCRSVDRDCDTKHLG